MQQGAKYARIERERRFLLDRLPARLSAVRVRRIYDRYIDGTSLRLRQQNDEGGAPEFKLTQKVPVAGRGVRQERITTIYLTESEYRVIKAIPARELVKTRYSAPPFGIDVFAGELDGLFLAEAEFESDEAARALEFPTFALREVTGDERFTGGRLALTSSQMMKSLLGRPL